MLLFVKRSKQIRFFVTCSIILLFLASCTSSIGWHQIETTVSPPAVTAASVAYNVKTQKAILFGGSSSLLENNVWEPSWSNETWEWDGNGWKKLTPSNAPVGREKHVMVYDTNRDRIVLFGGSAGDSLFNDTWEWDGTNWQLMKPDHSPSVRCCHAMAFDSSKKRVVLYGGWDSQQSIFYNDIWLWDGNDWSQDLSNAPQMSGHFLIDFPQKNEVISVQTANAGTWAWDGNQFLDLEIESPPSRTDVRVAYDPQNSRLVMFGGIRDKVFLNDTWIFDGSSWFEVHVPVIPSPRFGQVMFYDTKRNSVIMFGGFQNDSIYLNDTWELKLPSDLSGYKITSTNIPAAPQGN